MKIIIFSHINFIKMINNTLYIAILILKINNNLLFLFKKKIRMDVSGIEPEAFRMQIERDTTTPYTRIYIFFMF